MIAVDTSALIAIALREAKVARCPLLYKGHDFARTDVDRLAQLPHLAAEVAGCTPVYCVDAISQRPPIRRST